MKSKEEKVKSENGNKKIYILLMTKRQTRKPHFRENPAYAVPAFLQGIVTHTDYIKWLNQKCDSMRQRDLKLKRPWAKENSRMAYKQKIHGAVIDGGQFDPYTGEKLDWSLISRQRSAIKYAYVNDFLDTFALLPAVDHIGSDTLEFEICSWIVNEAKSCMDPDEFVGLCKKVVDYRLSGGKSLSEP
jgi:hypothetical protein